MKPEKNTGAQIFAYFFTFIRFAFAGRRGRTKKFLSLGTEPFFGGSGFNIMQSSMQV